MKSDASTNRNLRRIATARAISLAGIDASAIALSFGLYAMTRSAAWLAAGMLVSFGLSSVLGPFGGRVADIFDRKKLMIGSELVGAAAFVSLCIWHAPVTMLALSVVATCAGLVFGPASGAAIPQLAGEGELARANSMIATGGNIGKTVGRIGSGLVIAAAGFSTVFAINAVTFLISAALIASVSWNSHGASPELGQRLQKMNWRLPFQNPAIRPVLLSSCSATFMTGFSMTAETVLVFDFHAGPIGLGGLTACWGIGMVAGSWLSGYALREDNEMNYLLLGRLAMGFSIAGVGLTPWFWAALPCYFVGGAGGGLLLVASQGIMQRNVAQAMLGQLLATCESAKTAALGVGLLCAGTVVAVLGAQHTYLLVGIGVVCGAMPVAFAVLRDRQQSQLPARLAAAAA